MSMLMLTSAVVPLDLVAEQRSLWAAQVLVDSFVPSLQLPIEIFESIDLIT